MSIGQEQKVGAVCATLGSLLLLLGTFLHPMDADPHDSPAAFGEYAANRIWIASHLTQLAGIALMVGALLILAKRLETAGSRRQKGYRESFLEFDAQVVDALQQFSLPRPSRSR